MRAQGRARNDHVLVWDQPGLENYAEKKHGDYFCGFVLFNGCSLFLFVRRMEFLCLSRYLCMLQSKWF